MVCPAYLSICCYLFSLSNYTHLKRRPAVTITESSPYFTTLPITKAHFDTIDIKDKQNEGSNTCGSTVTSAVLNICYDGTHFHGWSSANDGEIKYSKTKIPEEGDFPYVNSRRKRRNRGQPKIRSVEGTLRSCLAKLYGDVDPMSIDVVACSRTDKGVHARTLVAKFGMESKELPFGGDLQKTVHVLNRMLPQDCRVSNIAPPPTETFHPTIDAISKTYKYAFSVGDHKDPLRWRHEWQLEESGTEFELEKARSMAAVFVGTHDFSAFRAAFRGNERGRVKDPMCTIFSIDLAEGDRGELNFTPPPIGANLVGGSEDAAKTFVISIRGEFRSK